MIIGFARRGTGEARHPVGYLTSPHAKDGSLRDPLPEVLRGNPGEIRALIDALPFKHKYTSGWLSFAPGEKVTREMENHLMDSFEDTVFAGLGTDQRPPVLWVRHMHTSGGRHEMHFLTPRVELSTGRSLNIAPPTFEARNLLNTYRDMINASYGLASPNDPKRARDVGIENPVSELRDVRADEGADRLLNRIWRRLEDAREEGEKFRGTTKLREELRLIVSAYVRGAVDDGRISSREDVIAFLEGEGLAVTRTRKDSVTIAIPGLQAAFPELEAKDARIRLRGGLFAEDFNPEADGERSGAALHFDRPDPEYAASLARRLEDLKEKRAAYHRSRYGGSAADNENFLPDLGKWMENRLGPQAIRPDTEAFQRNLLMMKRRHVRRRRVLQKNAATGQYWVQEYEEEVD